MPTCESSAPLEIIDAPVPNVSHGDGTRSGKAKYRANIAHASTATEIDAAVPDKLVEFLEAVLVQQQLDALARRELAFLVLPRAPFGPAALLGCRVPAP